MGKADASTRLDQGSNFDGIDYISLEVNGVAYSIPMGSPEMKQEMFFIKMAIEGNNEFAREVVLAGRKTKTIYIGNKSPLWLNITSTSEYVTKPGE